MMSHEDWSNEDPFERELEVGGYYGFSLPPRKKAKKEWKPDRFFYFSKEYNVEIEYQTRKAYLFKRTIGKLTQVAWVPKALVYGPFEDHTGQEFYQVLTRFKLKWMDKEIG